MNTFKIKNIGAKTTGWISMTDKEGLYYSSFTKEAILKINYSDNFDKFTYNEETGEYTCAEKVECTAYSFDGEILPTMYCFNNVVKVADGKITHIECDYEFEDTANSGSQKFIYYNIGIAEFEIPGDIKESAVPGGEYDGDEL